MAGHVEPSIERGTGEWAVCACVRQGLVSAGVSDKVDPNGWPAVTVGVGGAPHWHDPNHPEVPEHAN